MDVEIQDRLSELKKAIKQNDMELIRSCASDLIWDYYRGHNYIGIENKYQEEIWEELKNVIVLLKKICDSKDADVQIRNEASKIIKYITILAKDMQGSEAAIGEYIANNEPITKDTLAASGSV